MTDPNEFEQIGQESKSSNPLIGLWKMLMDNKKWWMIPIVIVLILMGALILLGGSAAAPFIYTLF
ncbi:MAG: DUF5989 family protein [Opitutales bacterium]|nr:DUF5989 family protein [Opitutales bacterium]